MPKLSRAHLVFGVIQLLAAQVLGCKSDPDTHDVDSGVLPTAGSGGSSAGSGGASAGSSGTSAGSSGTSGASAGSGGSSGTNAGAGSSGTSADPDAGPQTDGAVEPGLDAGPPGTYPTDRASFGLGAASQCGSAASAGLLLCDGFEGAQIDQATWQLDTWGDRKSVV